MTNEINELNIQIGNSFVDVIPADFTDAWLYYSGGYGVTTTLWYCYKDKKLDKIIPADSIWDRKDVFIYDKDAYRLKTVKLMRTIVKTQKQYLKNLNQKWYEMTFELDGSGKFNISFVYERPEGSLQERREKWCIDHLGFVPVVKIEDLRR